MSGLPIIRGKLRRHGERAYYRDDEDEELVHVGPRRGAGRGSRRVRRATARKGASDAAAPQRRDPRRPRPEAADHPAVYDLLGCSRLLAEPGQAAKRGAPKVRP